MTTKFATLAMMIFLTIWATGCGGSNCSGSSCEVSTNPTDPVTRYPGTDASGTAHQVLDCGLNGSAYEADTPFLFYNNKSSSAFPVPASPGLPVNTTSPVVVWRSVCNRSSEDAAATTVQWTRQRCVDTNTCSQAPVNLGTSDVPAQAKCLCSTVFIEDNVTAPGLYKYELLQGTTTLAHATFNVVQ